MKAKKFLIFLIQVSLVVGLVAGVTYYDKKLTQPVKVLAWKTDMLPNTKVVPENFTWQTISKNSLLPTMITEKQLAKVAGKYTNTNVWTGDYVSLKQLTSEKELTLFAGQNPANLRKISISANITNTLGNDLKPGDRVDLIGVIEPKQMGEVVQTATFINNVPVLNVKDEVGMTVSTGKEQTSAPKNSSGRPAVITLAVDPNQAELIAKWETLGTIKVIGRF